MPVSGLVVREPMLHSRPNTNLSIISEFTLERSLSYARWLAVENDLVELKIYEFILECILAKNRLNVNFPDVRKHFQIHPIERSMQAFIKPESLNVHCQDAREHTVMHLACESI